MYLCAPFGSQNKTRFFPNVKNLIFGTEILCVFWEVQTEINVSRFGFVSWVNQCIKYITVSRTIHCYAFNCILFKILTNSAHFSCVQVSGFERTLHYLIVYIWKVTAARMELEFRFRKNMKVLQEELST
jgi:hypothetical protein